MLRKKIYGGTPAKTLMTLRTSGTIHVFWPSQDHRHAHPRLVHQLITRKGFGRITFEYGLARQISSYFPNPELQICRAKRAIRSTTSTDQQVYRHAQRKFRSLTRVLRCNTLLTGLKVFRSSFKWNLKYGQCWQRTMLMTSKSWSSLLWSTPKGGIWNSGMVRRGSSRGGANTSTAVMSILCTLERPKNAVVTGLRANLYTRKKGMRWHKQIANIFTCKKCAGCSGIVYKSCRLRLLSRTRHKCGSLADL